MDTKKTTRLAMLLALSVVLSLIESLIPISGAIPGLKLGIANTVVVFAIIMYSFKDALVISITRIFLVGLLRTGLFNITFFFSLGGALLSIIMMFMAYKTKKFSTIGISIIGAISHNIGQIIVAIFMLNTINLIYYLPFLLLFSIPSGIIVGLTVKGVLNYYKLDAKNI